MLAPLSASQAASLVTAPQRVRCRPSVQLPACLRHAGSSAARRHACHAQPGLTPCTWCTGRDALISVCRRQANCAVSDPGHLVYHPEGARLRTQGPLSACTSCAGGDAFISICLWQAGYAVSDPGYSFYHPEVQMFDPGPEDRMGVMLKLVRALDSNRCDARCRVRPSSEQPAGQPWPLAVVHVWCSISTSWLSRCCVRGGTALGAAAGAAGLTCRGTAGAHAARRNVRSTCSAC